MHRARRGAPWGTDMTFALITLDPDQARRRAIARDDMVACTLAFIDCKLPGSMPKENYSIIGAGVTQSKDQVVNLTEPHGFSVGAAAMPAGVTNNLHLHFSAEVFIVYSGRWRFRWGADGKEGEVEGGPGDVLSVPTWIFRGFSNIGTQDGWIFTALGGDNTGGIIWHPGILAAAAQHGMYLGRDGSLIEAAPGQTPAAELIEPLHADDVALLPRYDAAAMRARMQRPHERDWSEQALLGATEGCALSPVIGYGLSEDRRQQAPILNPHGFSIDWLRLDAGASTGRFALRNKLVLIVQEGALDVVINAPPHAVVIRLEAQGVYSLPASVWCNLRQAGDRPTLIALIACGDARQRIHWSEEARAAGAHRGLTLDPDGYLAEARLLPPSALGVGYV